MGFVYLKLRSYFFSRCIFFNEASQIAGLHFNSSNLCHSLRLGAKPALKQYKISNTWSEIVWLVSEQPKNYRMLSWITPESFKQEYLLWYSYTKQTCNGKVALEFSVGKLKQAVIVVFSLKGTEISFLCVKELMELTSPTKPSELIWEYNSGNIWSIK